MKKIKSNYYYYIIFVFIIVGIAFIIITNQSNVSQSQRISNNFETTYQELLNNAQNTSQSLGIEIGKWRKGQIDNNTLILVFERMEPKYMALLNEADNIPASERYNKTINLTIQSIKSEIKSNEYFKKFLNTGNASDNYTSYLLLSDAFKYESEAFDSLREARNGR